MVSSPYNAASRRFNWLIAFAMALTLQWAALPGRIPAEEKPPSVSGETPLSPTDAGAWLRKGMEQNAAGRYQEALEAFQQAAAIDPANAFVRFNLGTSAALLGRYREAAGYLTEAVQIAPDLLPAWSNLGALYNHLEQPSDALAAYRQVLKLQPANAEAHYRAALALIALGRVDEARAEYEALRSLDAPLAEKLLAEIPTQK